MSGRVQTQRAGHDAQVSPSERKPALGVRPCGEHTAGQADRADRPVDRADRHVDWADRQADTSFHGLKLLLYYFLLTIHI